MYTKNETKIHKTEAQRQYSVLSGESKIVFVKESLFKKESRESYTSFYKF